MTEVSEILTKAADLLEKPGAWAQGIFASDDERELHLYGWEPGATCFCIMGATQAVIADGAAWWDRRVDLVNALTASLGSNPQYFNDTPGRTQAEVVVALRAAAEAAK